MDKIKKQRRQRRGRKAITGTKERPRAVVWRSLRTIGVQLIDDSKGITLLSVWSKQIKDTKGKNKSKQAEAVGLKAAIEAKAKGMKKVVFDRAGYRYHGRVKAMAEAMRQGGLEF